MSLVLLLVACDESPRPGSAPLVCPLYVAQGAQGGDGSAQAPFASIAQAISASGDCAQVLVEPGTYTENVVLGPADLELRSTQGAASTLISPTQGSAVVTRGQSAASVLQGFTLTGVGGTPGEGPVLDPELEYGGGVFAYGSDTQIVDCVLQDNQVSGQGAGAMLYEWHGVLATSSVLDNEIIGDKEYGGGGLYLYKSQGEVRESTFHGNRHEQYEGGDGGAILVRRGSPQIHRNVFRDNSAGGTGGAIRSSDAQAWVANNLFVDNQPDAVTFSYDDGGSFVHNTVLGGELGVRLHAPEEFYEGEFGPTTSVQSNLLSGSTRSEVLVRGVASPVAFSSNLLWPSEGDSVQGIEPGDSLLADPLLEREFRPSALSPAVDAGDSALSDQDIDGNPREDGAPDIGCVER